jgi:hypothetical protein
MIELDTDLPAKQILAECKRRGLLVKEISGGSSSQYPGSRHWHIRRPEGSGTLELTEFGDRVWLKVAANRDGGWATALARKLVLTST